MQVVGSFHCGDGRRLMETSGDTDSVSCLQHSPATATWLCLKQCEVQVIVQMLPLMTYLCDQEVVRRTVSTAVIYIKRFVP